MEPTAGGQLVIQKVNRDTIGRFFCMAKNDKGETKSNLIMLNVQCKLIFFQSFFSVYFY